MAKALACSIVLGLLGGSYGGYMVAWIAGNWTKPWKCLVNHDGVFDIRLMSYSTELKPQNSVQWYATVEAWMKRWLDH